MLNWKHGVNPYSVSTAVYEGPFDLLLSLIEKAELDITKLSLAKVTDEFLRKVRSMQVAGAENVSGFLVVAAKLLQIKSEALLPRKSETGILAEDPAADLAQQLIEYKRYKEKSAYLQEMLDEEKRTFIRINPPFQANIKADMTGLSIHDITDLFTSSLIAPKFDAGINSIVPKIRVTIREKINSIISHLRVDGSMGFRSLLSGARKDNQVRTHIVVSFLALLELVKRHIVKAEQGTPFEDIQITPSDEWSESVEIRNLEFGDS